MGATVLFQRDSVVPAQRNGEAPGPPRRRWKVLPMLGPSLLPWSALEVVLSPRPMGLCYPFQPIILLYEPPHTVRHFHHLEVGEPGESIGTHLLHDPDQCRIVPGNVPGPSWCGTRLLDITLHGFIGEPEAAMALVNYDPHRVSNLAMRLGRSRNISFPWLEVRRRRKVGP